MDGLVKKLCVAAISGLAFAQVALAQTTPNLSVLLRCDPIVDNNAKPIDTVCNGASEIVRSANALLLRCASPAGGMNLEEMHPTPWRGPNLYQSRHFTLKIVRDGNSSTGVLWLDDTIGVPFGTFVNPAECR